MQNTYALRAWWAVQAGAPVLPSPGCILPAYIPASCYLPLTRRLGVYLYPSPAYTRDRSMLLLCICTSACAYSQRYATCHLCCGGRLATCSGGAVLPSVLALLNSDSTRPGCCPIYLQHSRPAIGTTTILFPSFPFFYPPVFYAAYYWCCNVYLRWRCPVRGCLQRRASVDSAE